MAYPEQRRIPIRPVPVIILYHHDGDTLYSPQFNSMVKTFKFDGHYYQGPLRTSNADVIDNNLFKCRYPSDVQDIKPCWTDLLLGKKGMMTICMNENEFRRFPEYNRAVSVYYRIIR